MALDFYLKLKSSLSPEEVTDLILKLDNVKKDEENYRFLAEGLIGGVFEMDEISQEVLQEEVGIEANLRVWCWIDSEKYETGMRNCLKIFMSILQQTDGDAVITLNGDDVRLLRVNGKITLNPRNFFEEDTAMWRFKDVPFSNYTIKELELIS